MRFEHRLKQILATTRDIWDCEETRSAVRENFNKVLNCQTFALGAEVYASETEEKVFPHTCKSRACPICGYRATLLWQREQWALLPDIPYVGIVLTMPDVLWPIFQQNRHLLHDLPALGAEVIQQWAKAKYGVRVLIMVVPHSFGARLNFNSHLHILVSAGGLQESASRWIASLTFDKEALMSMWRYAVIVFLSEALKANVLTSKLAPEDFRHLLRTLYERWWNIHIDRLVSKEHFLRYAARYVRRLPIALHRLLKVTDREVQFAAKDRKTKRLLKLRYSVEEFVAALGDHVPDRYRHAIRYFGLWAPGVKGRGAAVLFVLLGQKRRPRPQRLSWPKSLQKYFGVNPLIDSRGQPMHWVRRLKPVV